MDEKQLKFLDTIGINEDYMKYFEGSRVLKVLIDKNSNRFHFVIKIVVKVTINLDFRCIFVGQLT